MEPSSSKSAPQENRAHKQHEQSKIVELDEVLYVEYRRSVSLKKQLFLIFESMQLTTFQHDHAEAEAVVSPSLRARSLRAMNEEISEPPGIS